MPKVRYEIDPYNRLVINETGRKTLLPRYRKIVDGHFKIDKNNALSYLVKTPVSKDLNMPHHVKLKGEWSLTKNYDLRLSLDKWERETLGDKLTLQGNIVETGKNSLLFAVTTKSKQGTQSTYILKLRGSWLADKYNRLTFSVQKEKGRHDILTFDGAWKLNKNHQIIYTYQKAELVRKSKKIHTLTFKGYWDIKDRARISYVIDINSDSVFNFTTGLGIFKDNYIKYEVGIGLFSRLSQGVILYGKWRIKRNIGLIFDIKYEGGKIHSIGFSAEAKLTDRELLLFKLKKEAGGDIVGRLELRHKILKGEGESFLRLLKSRRESAIMAGAGYRW
ncbi:MAG: hypothetical protein HQ579_07925 [Candidatus Omnitrophica bacterium]|nr:hypothetical protein [Candidatus Omnitrophota bacterium]